MNSSSKNGDGLDRALRRLDNFIEERERLVCILEEYLHILDSIDNDEQQQQQQQQQQQTSTTTVDQLNENCDDEIRSFAEDTGYGSSSGSNSRSSSVCSIGSNEKSTIQPTRVVYLSKYETLV